MTSSRVLIRAPKSAAPAMQKQGFAAAGGAFKITPLFEVSPGNASALAAAPSEPMQWMLAETDACVDAENPWDLAHRALTESGGLGFAVAGQPVLVEPDIKQTWPYPAPPAAQGAALAAAPQCVFADQMGDLPKGPAFAWHLADQFSGLKSARDAVAPGNNVLIAHLDTGYDAAHVTLPEGLQKNLQHNFVDADRPNDATDPRASGFLQNPGHGTGTLSILAGNKNPASNDYTGGAPHARIVPVRVANSVVDFFTSSIAQGFNYAREVGADVISMSMGGLASSAWTDAVNAAYEAGIFIVCAAGNNFGGLPTRNIVYPARFRRVVAACGVMANKHAYFGLPITTMQGNFGPPSKMATTIAAYTPNVTWARIGCAQLVDMNGQGTSAATPQVAAAAALWLSRHQPKYAEGWMRVEAARKGLFSSAAKTASDVSSGDFADQFGNGLLQAGQALTVPPAPADQLKKTPLDHASFPFLRVITGLGITGEPRTEMMAIEMTQLAQKMKVLEEIIPDPDIAPNRITTQQRKRFFEAIVAEGKCSTALREHLEQQYISSAPARVAAATTPATAAAPTTPLAMARKPVPPRPAHRRLRIFALDPSYSSKVDTAAINIATIKVPWEAVESENSLQPGPVGEYVEVVDVDPASGACYAPVDLNEPFLLAQDGLSPSEGNAQFHQQMAYAVAMLTIRNFEEALGRAALWSPRHKLWPVPDEPGKPKDRDVYIDAYVPRLRIYPHALRQANAFYSPEKKALLFGYFPSVQPDATISGGMVFTCLSHDIVAHETTHALLDGLHRRYEEATNRDVLAFHEAFADIVALFQHFTFPEVLRFQIQAVGGNLANGEMLAGLAQQFGEALGRSRALRSAINVDPSKINYNTTTEPHDRGSVLVAAVFDAFMAIYKRRVADLLRIATGGTGNLPSGALHPDLVNRLADEAAKTAKHVVTICIRALDYCPPIDITYGSYLRALITADWDVVPDDPFGYRVAFVEAFKRRSIYPENSRTLSIDTLRWQAPAQQPGGLEAALATLVTDWDLFKNRRKAFEDARANCIAMHKWISQKGNISTSLAQQMGIDLDGAGNGAKPLPLEVHSVRPARRVAPDGSFLTDLVVVLTQRRKEPIYPDQPELGTFWFRGGCTMLIDLRLKRVRYIISRNINSAERLARQRSFEQDNFGSSLNSLYFGDVPQQEPFALLHRGF